jgi:hypothetical protein
MRLFDGLEVKDIEKPAHVVKDLPILNGSTPRDLTMVEGEPKLS